MANIPDIIKFINEYPHPDEYFPTKEELIKMVIHTLIVHLPNERSLEQMRTLEITAIERINNG